MFLASGINIDNIIGFRIPGEFISALIVILIIIILSLIIGFKAKRADPLKKPKGILNIAEILVSFVDDQVSKLMGPKFKNFGGYVLGLGLLELKLLADVGLLGFPNPFTYLGITLAIALCTIGAIHITSMRFKHLSYFKRYVEPLPFFLPINLVSMWAPVFSLSFRLFGNALAGYCIVTICYLAFSIPDSFSFGFVVTPLLHAYFDIFDGLIQMAVFTMLTMVNVAQEAPESEEDSKLLTEQLA